MTLCAAVAVLLTGCGSEDPKAAGEGGKPAPTASPSATPPAGWGSSSAPAKSGGATHQVTLEVGGTGQTAIMFSGIGSGFEQQTLPWSKSGTAELTAAEQKVGYLVNVVPGTITGAGGKLQQAPCKITVDGKTVAESDGVTTTKGCSYTIKQ
ncbi:hypothetical protein [Streptomyces sp. NBC_01408]|uniref:hypothetical protein n=1 Tax=Streptomyces sp. NBC_01408 TaxID=2903855 RepID=UPI0022507D4A|nr:hypothetical protein [Streptomyces sp. NBC_01408]MCX4693897.1 hypothetical protein [Streptomyces sp. NBC_01408]